jgi:hypothetical protein
MFYFPNLQIKVIAFDNPETEINGEASNSAGLQTLELQV